MNIVGIIPARYASTRFPGKPLANIKGKSMIQRVYEQAGKVLQHVCVATDDERIYNTVTQFGGQVVYTDANHPSGTDRCAEAVAIFEKKINMSADVVINIQGDEPFIDPKQITQLAELFAKPDTEIATLVKPISNADDLFDTNKVKVTRAKNGNALYFSRNCIPHLRGIAQKNWVLKHRFYHHVGMYAYRKKILFEICRLEKSELEMAESLEQLRWLENGYYIKTAITNIESFGIDTPEDLAHVLKKLL